MRILLVEDDFISRETLRAFLTDAGHDLIVESDGQSGVHAWQSLQPDLVLMDLMLPVMDGVAAIRSIRRREREAGTLPVGIVVLSATDDEPPLEQARDAGADDFLPKPFSPTVVQARMALWHRVFTLEGRL
ncbi:MAG: response regulator [Magnetococcus sp. WYHC-3]